MACMADDQKEDTDMDQLHNFLQNTLPRVAKTHNLDITAELESLRSKLQISTDRVSKSNSNVEMLLANRLRNISMDHNDDFGHRELGCKSGDGKSDNTLKQSKRRFQIRRRIWHKHYDQSIPADTEEKIFF